jgi:hypothetical protein
MLNSISPFALAPPDWLTPALVCSAKIQPRQTTLFAETLCSTSLIRLCDCLFRLIQFYPYIDAANWQGIVRLAADAVLTIPQSTDVSRGSTAISLLSALLALPQSSTFPGLPGIIKSLLVACCPGSNDEEGVRQIGLWRLERDVLTRAAAADGHLPIDKITEIAKDLSRELGGTLVITQVLDGLVSWTGDEGSIDAVKRQRRDDDGSGEDGGYELIPGSTNPLPVSIQLIPECERTRRLRSETAHHYWILWLIRWLRLPEPSRDQSNAMQCVP